MWLVKQVRLKLHLMLRGDNDIACSRKSEGADLRFQSTGRGLRRSDE